jgi:hypothetical protein
LAGISAGVGLLTGRAARGSAAKPTVLLRKTMRQRFLGVQVSPQSVFDEGADHMLDYLQREAEVDTLCVATHTPHGGMGRPKPNQFADHGVPQMPGSGKPLTSVWIPYDAKNFAGTRLRMPQGDPGLEEFAGRDVLDAVLTPAHRRGMKIYARHLEGFHENLIRSFPTFLKVRQLDVHGTAIPAPCWSNPEYRNFWHGYVTDVIRRYPIDGFLLGSERDSPLEPMLHHRTAPYCFCDHCRRRAARANIDADRAREGMAALHRLLLDDGIPVDGMLTSILRLWLRYPEILAWESLQSESKASLYSELYRTAKRLRPELDVGWHLPMYPLNHDLFTRAAWDYGRLAETCDFLKPSVYYDVNASRLHGTVAELERGYLREFKRHEIYDFFISALNLDAAKEPSYETAKTAKFSSDYVFRETRRCVVGCAGRAATYAGIGVDVPKDEIRSDPEAVGAAASAALSAGAGGLLLSREYHFMRKESLNAVRSAVRTNSTFLKPANPV